jgi:hypothetical protein
MFHFVLNLIWDCFKWVQIALFASWNNFDFQCLFLIGCLISRIFYNHCSICVLKVAGVALYGFWTQNEDNTVVSSTFVQDLSRAAPATFRMHIEQIRTHFEQPQIRFRTKLKIWTLFEPKHKNFKCLLKIEGSLSKNLNIKRLVSISSPLKQYHFHAILIWRHSPFKGPIRAALNLNMTGS